MENDLYIPKTLHEAIQYFSDPDTAHNFVVALRWPDVVTCPYCGGQRLSFLKSCRRWHCYGCKKRFSVKVGTIMEDSPLKLEIWMAAFWLITGAKNGISSCEVSRALGITQKTAWFLLHRIRHVMDTGSMEKMKGHVEIDETAIGGLEKNKHEDMRKDVGGGTGGKEIVIGFLERGGDVRTKHIQGMTQKTLKEEIRANIKPGADLYTDSWTGYKGIDMDYGHQTVNHNIGQYVKGNATTNRIENYWSVLKRGLKGSYIHVSKEHLHRYLSEQEFRFNNRQFTDRERFAVAIASTPGKRLTYKKLTAGGSENLG